jgi:hypothetical protein
MRFSTLQKRRDISSCTQTEAVLNGSDEFLGAL